MKYRKLPHILAGMLTYMHPETVKKFLETNNLKNLKPTLDSLTKLGRAFQKIPYENMTKIIRAKSIDDPKVRIRLPELLYEEHLRFGTGGTCFSMTYFLQTILKSLGFNTYPVIADRPLAPNTHCLSIVKLNSPTKHACHSRGRGCFLTPSPFGERVGVRGRAGDCVLPLILTFSPKGRRDFGNNLGSGNPVILDPGFLICQPLPLTEIPTIHRLRHNDITIGAKEPGTFFIATSMHGENKIRYYFKDRPLTSDQFLNFWHDSFNWPTLRNISITVATDSGYNYARNNFLRKTTREGKVQERIKKGVELELKKAFNIDEMIIHEAFETLTQCTPPHLTSPQGGEG